MTQQQETKDGSTRQFTKGRKLRLSQDVERYGVTHRAGTVVTVGGHERTQTWFDFNTPRNSFKYEQFFAKYTGANGGTVCVSHLTASDVTEVA